ncbi:ABC transporter ATP-binding protein [Clostridium sp. CTA-19]
MKFLYTITAGNPKNMIKPVLWEVATEIINMIPFACITIIINIIYEYHAKEIQELNFNILWIAFSIMIIFFLIVFICKRKSYRAIVSSAYKTSTQGRIKIAEHLRKLPLGFLMSKDSAELGSMIMNDITLIEEASSDILPQLIGGIIVPIIALVGMAFIDWRLSLSMFLGFPISILIIVAISNFQRNLATKHSMAKLEQSNCIEEYLAGIKVIKAYNLTGKNFSKLNQAFYNFMKMSIKQEGLVGPFFLVAVSFIKSGLSFISISGVYLILNKSLTIPIFALFLLVGTRIFDPLSAAITKLPELKYDMIAGERIIHLLNQPKMTGEGSPNNKHNIKFNNVTFGYKKNMVLNNINTEIKEGELTAIVGPSGSGKSTMLRLIARFYDPNDGMITLGNKNLCEINSEKLMKKISMVFQDVYLFEDTIGNNIRYGKSNATQQEIEEAAKKACCHDFIVKLPKGYNTIVGEGGSTLSGGEKQRISIARAILKDAPLVLLDEATSSLDPENELDVQRAINELVKNRTIIMIAHKLRTVVNADKIIVIDNGKIVEEGNHEYLIKKQGLYFKLWNLQMKTRGWKITS